MDAKITAAFVAGLTVAVMACVYALPTPQAAELPPQNLARILTPLNTRWSGSKRTVMRATKPPC